MIFADFFQSKLFQKIPSGIPSMSNSLDLDEAQCFVGPDLGPNCLQMLSSGKELTCCFFSIFSLNI